MMIILIYLFLFQISFVITNELFSSSVSSGLNEVATLTQAKLIQARNRANVPQSLTLLMNFKDDGTTSFQIMQGKYLKYILNSFEFSNRFTNCLFG
jgi:hypothetical protein